MFKCRSLLLEMQLQKDFCRATGKLGHLRQIPVLYPVGECLNHRIAQTDTGKCRQIKGDCPKIPAGTKESGRIYQYQHPFEAAFRCVICQGVILGCITCLSGWIERRCPHCRGIM